jgi:hypothetical protein
MSLQGQVLRNPEAFEAAQAAVRLTPYNPVLMPYREKVEESLVCYNEGPNGPEIAVKAERDPGDGSLLAERRATMQLAEKLHNSGAPVEEHVFTPMQFGQYVVSITSYLPRSYQGETDLTSFGRGLARFHATPLDSSLTDPLRDHLPVYDPLAVTRDTFEKLVKLEDDSNLPRLGGLVFDSALVDKFGLLLAQAEAAVEKLEALTEEEVLLHTDITLMNALRNAVGEACFIDLGGCSRGSRWSDLARVAFQWPYFGRDPKMVQTLLGGYMAETGQPLNIRQLQLAGQIAEARFGGTLLTRTVRMTQEGIPLNPFLLEESINRISAIPDRSGKIRWHSEEDYIRSRMPQR